MNKKVIGVYKGVTPIAKIYKGSMLTMSKEEDIDPSELLAFEFTGSSVTFKMNDTTFTATTSPYQTSLKKLGIDTWTSAKQAFDWASKITKFTSIPDTSNVTNMYCMFNYCRSLTSLDLSSFNTSNVTDMSEMFKGCRGLTSLDLSSFDTSNVGNMSYMFSNCSKLTSLDVSSFDTSNVGNMASMFGACEGLTSLDLSSFDTSNIKSTHNMFSGCTSLTSLVLSSFDTSNVTDMSGTFYACKALTSLDLSNFNTSNVGNMDRMFGACSGLTSLDLSNWDCSNVTGYTSMFSDCSGLTSINVSNCDEYTISFIKARLTEAGLDTSIVKEWHSLTDVVGTDTQVRYMRFNTSEPKLTDYTMYIRVNVGFTEVYATLAPNPDKPTELICNVGGFGIETTFDMSKNISFTGLNISDYTVDYITISSIDGADAEEAMTMIKVATE